MMDIVFRHARPKDIPTIQRILKPWADADASLHARIDSLLEPAAENSVRCMLLESGKVIRAVSLWTVLRPLEVKMLAFGVGPGGVEIGADEKLLEEEILEWAAMGIGRVELEVPREFFNGMLDLFDACGFIFEGVSTGRDLCEPARVRLAKRFFYETIPQTAVPDLLERFMSSLGYEVKNEEDGFAYRARREFRFPFMFSQWQHVSAKGPEIIIHPPARVLERHELETMFFPLRIRTRADRPLVLSMDKQRARTIIELPSRASKQSGLFDGSGEIAAREVFLNNLTYSYPAGLKSIRKGLPLLFYVNKVGAVGTGRVKDWYLDEPENLYNLVDDMGRIDPEDVREHVGTSGANEGKVLVIRFHWYRPLKRVMTLEQIRGLSRSFNPQRTHSVSTKLFDEMLSEAEK